ncbi:MAG: N-acetylmuramoyl-L-alanine amidase [Epibacterium sp.]|nr:N-acetylmuramoyl-L-alanine amidase [Epibacterium sp.]NQX75848.1 N-acetylmuramoyl-L-alanine amidase [Epibacterium sp.]
MRPITTIIIHCTATRPDWRAGQGIAEKVAEVRRWHLERGFSDIGYHYLIDRDGQVMVGRELARIGAHVKGHNTGSIGIALFGGHGSAESDQFADNFTSKQADALETLLDHLRDEFNVRTIRGHNEYAAKACPGFQVREWLDSRKPAPSLFSILRNILKGFKK